MRNRSSFFSHQIKPVTLRTLKQRVMFLQLHLICMIFDEPVTSNLKRSVDYLFLPSHLPENLDVLCLYGCASLWQCQMSLYSTPSFISQLIICALESFGIYKSSAFLFSCVLKILGLKVQFEQTNWIRWSNDSFGLSFDSLPCVAGEGNDPSYSRRIRCDSSRWSC